LKFDKDFWSQRYANNLLGWDTGVVTTPIKAYVDQLTNQELRILIPGCGQGHEAVYLHDQGYRNVTVIDLVAQPINKLRLRCPDWPSEQFIIGDFFEHSGSYDLIFEQTFFCALDPQIRQSYADKVYDLLRPGGKLVGLLFNFPLTENGPPFGGARREYERYFDRFTTKVMSEAYNSIKPRMGSELFINLQRPLQ
jgi:thiopurine S-methyltransferase